MPAEVDKAKCTGCESCVDECPSGAISMVDGKASVNPDSCIDCGACAPECPVDAIYPDGEVPDEYSDWIDKNRAFFEEGPGYSAA